LNQLDPSLFADVADAIRLPSPAFVEKDYYAIQLLKAISEIDLPDGKLIFAGGTCLTKAHLPTYRMSEDIDLKFIPGDSLLNLSDSQKRTFRSDFGSIIIKAIESSGPFKLMHKESRSEGRYRCLSVNYPKSHNHIALRPELKLEFTEIAAQCASPIAAPIGSIYAHVLKYPHEVQTLACDHIETILVEKFVGLLRRTAEVARGYSNSDDAALIRHVYDLHLITAQGHSFSNISDIFKQTIQRDIVQFGMRHTEFKHNPMAELLYGLGILTHDNKYKDRYEKFLGPLVYNANPPSWDNGIKSLIDLSAILEAAIGITHK
jgi:predicted nucleotidyltransferase component of viral defense system